MYNIVLLVYSLLASMFIFIQKMVVIVKKIFLKLFEKTIKNKHYYVKRPHLNNMKILYKDQCISFALHICLCFIIHEYIQHNVILYTTLTIQSIFIIENSYIYMPFTKYKCISFCLFLIYINTCIFIIAFKREPFMKNDNNKMKNNTNRVCAFLYVVHSWFASTYFVWTIFLSKLLYYKIFLFTPSRSLQGKFSYLGDIWRKCNFI